MAKVKVHVEYCGGWGYGPKFRRFKEELRTKFEADFDQIEVTSYETPQTTGNFEVSVNGKLIHSKKNGDGYLDNATKLQKVCDAVKAALWSLTSAQGPYIKDVWAAPAPIILDDLCMKKYCLNMEEYALDRITSWSILTEPDPPHTYNLLFVNLYYTRKIKHR